MTFRARWARVVGAPVIDVNIDLAVAKRSMLLKESYGIKVMR